MDGVTRWREETPERFELDLTRAAQSRGECPGVSCTFCRGLGVFIGAVAGIPREFELGATGLPRLGTGPDEGTRREEDCGRRGGGGMSWEAVCLGNGFNVGGFIAGGFMPELDARCAELTAGNCGGGSLSSLSVSSESLVAKEKDGIVGGAVAFGVVGDSLPLSLGTVLILGRFNGLRP